VSTLIKGDFLRSLVVLLSGTVVAQVFNVAFIPVLSRVYSPDELGVLGFYMQIVMFLTALVTLRLELSLPIERYAPHRYALFRYAIRWTLLLCGLVFVPVLVIVLINDFTSVFNSMLILIPIGVVLHGLFNLGMYWELGSERFNQITLAKLTRSGSINGLKLLFGIFHFGPIGLIISVLIGMFISLFAFAKGFKESLKSFTFTRKSIKTKYLLHKHRDLYYFNLPHTLVDLTRDLILASFIMYSFSEHEFGSYNQSYFLLRLPLIFVGEAVGQALFSKCSTLVDSKKKIMPFVIKVVAGLTAASIIPFVTIFFFGSEIFVFVLGEEWVDSGLYSEIITWWAMVIFIASPLSFIPILLDRQRSYFSLNILRAVFLIGAIYIPYYLDPNISFETSLTIIALTQVCINALLLVYYGVIIRIHDNKIAL
jgi:O-antigen/teichoic acid export membrane protein